VDGDVPRRVRSGLTTAAGPEGNASSAAPALTAAPTYEPNGSTAYLVFQLRPGASNDATLVEFLTDLHCIEGGHVRLIWDGLPSHRSRRMLGEWLSIDLAYSRWVALPRNSRGTSAHLRAASSSRATRKLRHSWAAFAPRAHFPHRY
jgi:hypothetical protein